MANPCENWILRQQSFKSDSKKKARMKEVKIEPWMQDGRETTRNVCINIFVAIISLVALHLTHSLLALP